MTRLLTSFVLIPVILWTVIRAPEWCFLAALCTVAAICYHEFSTITGGSRSVLVAGLAAGLTLLLLPGAQFALVTLGALLAITVAMRSDDLSAALPQAATFVFGIVYVFGAWQFAVPLRAASPHWLLFALGLNWAGDAAAYYVGRAIGLHKLAPRVSPKKSWEGSIASVAASVLVAILYFPRFLPHVPLWQAALLAVAANAAGQLGDLSESAIKRGAGVKDSGTLLPGHGGLLDRVDSSLFSIPVVYLFVRFV